MDLYDVAVARKLSSGGGGGVTIEELNVTDNGTYTAPTGKAYSPVKVNVSGGGSSDFTTAEVTVVNTLPDDIPVYIYGAFVVNGTLECYTEFSNGTSQKQVALYLGGVNVSPDEYDNVSVSGNATIDGGIITITGDCTITIS